MKKLFLIVLSFFILAGFSACSSGEKENPSAKDSESTVTDDTSSETQAETETSTKAGKEDKKSADNKNKETGKTKTSEKTDEGKTSVKPEISGKTAESKSAEKSETAAKSQSTAKSSDTAKSDTAGGDKKQQKKKNESGSNSAVTGSEQKSTPKHLIINGGPFTVTSEDGFDNAGVTCFICDEASMYSFKSGGKKVKWEVYVLAREFTDGARYLPQAYTPKLTGDGDLKIEHGRYIYILCEESSLTADRPSDAYLSIDYSKESDLSGTYNDSVSKRARANVDDSGETADVVVSWSSSADEGSVWRMTCKKEGNRLVYTDCEKTTYSLDDSGDDVSVVEFTDGKGYFTVSGDKLLWDGAAEESCKKCVFEKKQAKQ